MFDVENEALDFIDGCIHDIGKRTTYDFRSETYWRNVLGYIRNKLIKNEVSNTCVCCGEIIPEGRQVCPKCEKGGTE